MRQTGGHFTLSGSIALLTVHGDYEVDGGQALIEPINSRGSATDPYYASFGQLLVEAPGMRISGHVVADNGIHVTSSGDLVIFNGSENTRVTADILVDGTLHVGVAQ